MFHQIRGKKWILDFFAVLLPLAAPARLVASDVIALAAHDLAARIETSLGPLENVGLTVRNVSSLGLRDFTDSTQSIERELRSSGMRFISVSEASAKITVTLSENSQSYILVAEIQRDQSLAVVMTSQAKPEAARAPGGSSRMAIQVELVFEQGEPILDLAEVKGELVVLEPEWLSFYHRQQDSWQLTQKLPIPRAGTQPRDDRGRIEISGESIQVDLPGIRCNGATGLNTTLKCAQDQSGWTVDIGSAEYVSDKNYFVRKDLPPFFTVAGAMDDGARVWILAGVDGQTHVLDNELKQISAFPGWGSDIAGINTACGAKRQILVTLPTDPSARGAIQAFEFEQRHAVDVSAPAEFPGPVTALWPTGSAGTALAVSRDIRTGRYAAYQLSVSCGR